MDDNWAPAGTHHFIGNRWVASNEGQTIDVVDPSDGKPFARIARGDGADIDHAIRAARTVIVKFSETNRQDPVGMFRAVSAALGPEARVAELDRLASPLVANR